MNEHFKERQSEAIELFCIEERAGVLMIELKPNLNRWNANVFMQQLIKLIELKQPARVVIDLHNLSRIDDTTIRAFNVACQKISRPQENFVLCGFSSASVKETFRKFGFHHLCVLNDSSEKTFIRNTKVST